jgi:NAD(P)-dependent dehydrogenase (short-subunit alcohol dehydrogenase family)
MTVEKVALITAGGSGMGADAARKLADDGFKIGILSASGKGEALGQRTWRLWRNWLEPRPRGAKRIGGRCKRALGPC